MLKSFSGEVAVIYRSTCDGSKKVKIRIYDDPCKAKKIWMSLFIGGHLFSEWDIRWCFHESYGRPVYFVAAEGPERRPAGLIPLSWIEEEACYGFFPGETWKGRTWLEQNSIPAVNSEVTQSLWDAAPENTRIRYLQGKSVEPLSDADFDETGYILEPPKFDFDFSLYWSQFPGKSRKKIKRELKAFPDKHTRFEMGNWNDIEWMFSQNLENFGHYSYFHDSRFMTGFADMLATLKRWKVLRVVRMSVNGARTAVDVAAIYKNSLVVLAGATNPDFPGAAKAINLFHIKCAFEEKISKLDFLCGDFGWKKRFRLEERPLFKIEKTVFSDVQDGQPCLN